VEVPSLVVEAPLGEALSLLAADPLEEVHPRHRTMPYLDTCDGSKHAAGSDSHFPAGASSCRCGGCILLTIVR
jgi:hypothetical protein